MIDIGFKDGIASVDAYWATVHEEACRKDWTTCHLADNKANRAVMEQVVEND